MSSQQAAIAEFQALKAEMERVERLGPERVGLGTARRLANRFNAALAAAPEPGQLDEALLQEAHHAHSKEWEELSQQQRQAAKLLGWTQRGWDNNSRRPMAKTKWADLPVHKRLAAEQLGFLSRLWDDPETGSSAADAATKQFVFRCGNVKFQETNRTVPYLLVPRGATQSSEGQNLLLKHMRNVFKLDDTFFKLDDFGLRQGSPPTVVLRVCPGENLCSSAEQHSFAVGTPRPSPSGRRASVNERVEVNGRDESTPRSRSSLGESSIAGHDTQSFLSLSSPSVNDSLEVNGPGRKKHSTQALDCISKAIAFVLECKGCFITSADRTRGIELIGAAIEHGGRDLMRYTRVDCCRSPVWWIAHHNLRLSKAEAMSRDEYKGKDIDDLRKMCKKRRIEDVDQTIEFEALMELLVMDDLKKESKNHNKLKAAIRSHSVPLSDESAQQQANPPYTIEDSRLTNETKLHPYVSCLLFFEEHIEEDYEKQVEHLHHIFQRNGVPEGLIAPGIPSGENTDMDTSQTSLDDSIDLHLGDKTSLYPTNALVDDKMILNCINHDRVPVLTLWAAETGRENQIKLQRKMQDEVRRIQTDLGDIVGSEDATCGMSRLYLRYSLNKFCCGCCSSLWRAIRSERKMREEITREKYTQEFFKKYEELLNEGSAICCGCVKEAPREKLNAQIKKIAEDYVQGEHDTKMEGEAEGSISDNVRALEAVKKYKEQHRFMQNDYHRLQPALAREWYRLGTPGCPYDARRLNALAEVVLQGDAGLVRDTIPGKVLAVLDNGDSGTMRWLRDLATSENYGRDLVFRRDEARAIDQTIADIAKYNLNASRQEALADFCNVCLLTLQLLSVVMIVFQNKISNFGWLTTSRWQYLCDWAITLIPCLAGLLVTIIAKFEFTRRSQALRWAARALESELWRYRTRTGRYCRSTDTWTGLMGSESSESSFCVAYHPTRILKAYVRKQKAISHDKELERYHTAAVLLEPTEEEIEDTRMRVFPYLTKKDYDSYKAQQPSYLMSFWHGKEPFFGMLWDLYFDFLVFNEQDRIRSCIPNVQTAGPRWNRADGSSDDDCRGYCSSLLWRLVLVGLCTPLVALYTVGAPVYMIIAGLWSCICLGGRCLCDMCTCTFRFCCTSGREALHNDEQSSTGTPTHQAEMVVTGDQFFDVRFHVVYEEVKEQKRRYSNQHTVVLILQAVLNVAALIASEPDAVLSRHKAMSGAATAISLVGQPEPVALCLPSADVGTRERSDSWLETELDDECTQVMRYASCEDFRCTAFVAGATSHTIEESYPQCGLCAEAQPYATWHQLAASPATARDMITRCTGQSRMGRCTYEMVQREPDAISLTECEGDREVPDLFVAPLTAAMSCVMGLTAYFQVDRKLQSHNYSRMNLQQLGKERLSDRSIGPEWLARKNKLVDVTEKAFLFPARDLHGGDGDNDSDDDGQQPEEQEEDEGRDMEDPPQSEQLGDRQQALRGATPIVASRRLRVRFSGVRDG